VPAHLVARALAPVLLAAQPPARLQVVLPLAAQQPGVQLLVPLVALQEQLLDQQALRQAQLVQLPVQQLLALPQQVQQRLQQQRLVRLPQQPSL
jgi:hypothetical protein